MRIKQLIPAILVTSFFATGVMAQEGTWEGICRDSELLKVAAQTTYEFKDKEFTRIVTIFSDDDCKEAEATVTMTGEFKTSKVEGQKDIQNLDLRYLEMKIMTDSDFAAGVFDAVNFCGIDNWTVGEEEVVSEVGGNNCFIKKLPSTEYGRLFMNEDGDTLYLTDDFDDEEADRETDIDMEMPYTLKD